MSFPKAKLHRYYDDISCAPPPGKYDPKIENKVKGVIMDKGKRFSELGRSSSVESLESSCSSIKTPIFRTPSKVLSKKAPQSTPRSRLKSRLPLPDKLNPSLITDSDQKLIDQINELTRIHQNQLLEKNDEIVSLIDQVNYLNEKINTLLSSHSNDQIKYGYEIEINKLKEELTGLQKNLTTCNQDYKHEVDKLKSQITFLEENITNHASVNKDLEESLIENNSMFEEINSRITQLSNDFTLQLNAFIRSVTNIENVNKNLMDDYKKTVELLNKEVEENIQNKQQLIELQENLDNCRDNFNKFLKRCKMYEVVQTETSKTINVLSKRLMESEVDVDNLNVIQQDLISQKNSLENQVKTLFEENHTIKENFEKLQHSVQLDMENMEKELLDKVESYKQLSSEVMEQQQCCLVEKQKTIDILLAEVEDYKTKKSEVDQQVVLSQSKIFDYEEEISTLKITVAELDNDFKEKIGAQRALFSHLSLKYENLKNVSMKEKCQLEKKIVKLNEDKSSLERACLKKEKHINDLTSNMEILTQQISKKVSKIKDLESLSMNYEDKVDKISNEIQLCNKTIEEKTIKIEDLEKLVIEIKNEKSQIMSSLLEKSKECELINSKYESEMKELKDTKTHMKEMQSTNQKYMDEVISELVLEKERVSELVNTIENLNADLKKLKEQSVNLKNITLEYEKKISSNNKDELDKTRKLIQEQLEIIQIFEYERISQALCLEEFLDQKDKLLKTIERQRREIEVFSQAADRDFAMRRKLEQEVNNLNEEVEQLKDSGTEDSMKLTSLEASIADLECKNQELLDIIGPFKNQLIQFDQERTQLLSKSESTEKQLRALELEHAKSLGHQNHKQKIKHIVNLNETIANLKKELEKCRAENNKLRREFIIKKTSTLSSHLNKNKENRTDSETVARTTSPAKALKDRNA